MTKASIETSVLGLRVRRDLTSQLNPLCFGLDSVSLINKMTILKSRLSSSLGSDRKCGRHCKTGQQTGFALLGGLQLKQGQRCGAPSEAALHQPWPDLGEEMATRPSLKVQPGCLHPQAAVLKSPL